MTVLEFILYPGLFTELHGGKKDDRTSELLNKFGRAQLGIDGNCGFALLGGDLQEGESEFVEIKGDKIDDQLRACSFALNKLRERIDAPGMSYYFGPSHPYGN